MAENHRGVTAIATIPASVQTALRRTMVLGLPAVAADRPTFWFDREVEWNNHDAEGKPWDWTQAPEIDTTATPQSVQPICALEFFSPLGRQGSFPTEVGDFNPTTLVVTMLKVDFDDVYGASRCTIGPENRTWHFRFWSPAMALENLAVYQVHMVGA